MEDHFRINEWVKSALEQTPICDLHTHLYPAAFGPEFLLRGIDELLNYHYLQAEALRADRSLSYAAFWKLSFAQQAEFIWKTLFLDRAPLSEACRGVLTVLQRFGCDVRSKDLESYRRFFRSLSPEAHIDRVLELANVRSIVMTNNVFDPAERACWARTGNPDPRFKGVVRIDPLLRQWPQVGEQLTAMGYPAKEPFGPADFRAIRDFLEHWIDQTKALYLAASLTPEWRYPDASPATRIMDEVLLPLCRDRKLPMALMIGVRSQVNPRLRVAGDSVGSVDFPSVDRLCANHQGNRFLLTTLSRETQHDAVVAARKHRNLFLFGCWWFMNNPVLVEETTRMRLEMLGPTFAPQHSDARVLDQLVYKWQHTREALAPILTRQFTSLADRDWPVTETEVRSTVTRFLEGNFLEFLKVEAVD